MSKTSALTLSLLLLAALPLLGCDEEPCNACKADCPALNGAYGPWLQINHDDCGLLWNDGQAAFFVKQDLMNVGEDDEWTQLTMTLTQGVIVVSVTGELCQTEDDGDPRSYRFSGAHNSGPMDNQESTVIAGEFIVGASEKNICASAAVTRTTIDNEGTSESCSMSAALYTDKDCCEHKDRCQ